MSKLVAAELALTFETSPFCPRQAIGIKNVSPAIGNKHLCGVKLALMLC